MPFYFRLGKRSQQYNVCNKDLFVIPIELLTNEVIECTLFATSIGQECLTHCCQKININQPEYFGLLFKSRKNVDQWVDLNKPLKKQLDKFSIESRLYFRLQYFVPNFTFLCDEISRYHYFMAMKNLVLEGRIACSRDDAILLSSFSLQAEFGNYNAERHTVEYLNNFALFPKAMVTSKVALSLLIECGINAYRNLQGVPTNVAEIYYISEAQQRDGYGDSGFPARDLDTGQDVCLGVCIRGIFVMNTEANTVELFKWNDIANLVHNKKIFTIERSPDNYRKSFSTFDCDFASCIWRSCVEQHQYFMKGIHAVQQNCEATELSHAVEVNAGNMAGLSFMQNEPFLGQENFLMRKNGQIGVVDNSDYSQIRPVSLYETINKSPMSANPHEYSVNGYLDQKIEQGLIKKRSSTEPIELQHITLSYANGGAVNSKSDKTSDHSGLTYTQKKLQSKVTSNGDSPLSKSTSAPIYENQLNSSDLTYEQRKKLVPPYKCPPDYETFIKRKYSAMATLSQSMSSIPSRLASQPINSSSSSSSLAHPGVTGTATSNGIRNIIFSSSSTMSVPYMLQQHQQQQPKLQQHHQQQHRQPMFLSNLHKNYTDLSNLDLNKRSAGLSGRGSLPPPAELPPGRPSHPIVLNQLQHQKQQMQSSGMFTASSPELNNLNLLQKRTLQAKAEQVKQWNSTIRPLEMSGGGESNLKGRMHLPHCFTSVPDLTFRSHNSQHGNVHSDGHNEHKKLSLLQAGKAKNSLFGFTGKNLRIFRSQHNTGSVPNLCNDSGSNSNANCYNLPRPRPSTEHLGNMPQQRSNSITMVEHAPPRQMFSYSISGKIDEAPELVANKANECILAGDSATLASAVTIAVPQSNMYSPAHQQQHLQQQHVIYANLTTVQAKGATTNLPSPPPPPLPPVQAYAVSAIDPTSQPTLKNLHSVYNITDPKSTSVLVNGNPMNAHLQTPASEPIHQLRVPVSTVWKDEKQRNESISRITVNVPSINPSSTTSIAKSSRIIVFGKSFEDQDFTREFELLPRMNPTAKFTTASLPENVLKNRFRDILPYEENRVKLTPTKDNKHGYINASHVYMEFGTMRQHYIAAQGPLPLTTIDFWNMVLEQEIQVIGMFTNLTESGVPKCYSYFPLSSEPGKNSLRFADHEIVCNYTTGSSSNTFVTSSLTLYHNGQKRLDIIHLRYTDWNDHSIPGDLQGFLAFLSEMDAIYRRSSREGSGFGKKRSTSQRPPPILVHCSAGAGRSGVVILCDALLKALDHNFSEPIDIPQALIQLRFQRMISVQHAEQFRFVCRVLSQYLSNSRLI